MISDQLFCLKKIGFFKKELKNNLRVGFDKRSVGNIHETSFYVNFIYKFDYNN
jgi:hypothetical protein